MPNIDLAKLDAMLKGINLALQWQGKMLHMKTGNPDQESAIAYQGSRWDTHQEALEYTQGSGEGAQADYRHDVGYFNSQHVWPTDEDATVVV